MGTRLLSPVQTLEIETERLMKEVIQFFEKLSIYDHP
jgi:hypothetical protein